MQPTKHTLDNILKEDERRISKFLDVFNPITGEGCPGNRVPITISDFQEGQTLFLPESMLLYPEVLVLADAGSIVDFCIQIYGQYTLELRETVISSFTRIRCKEDFYFFAYAYARIKNKEGGEDIPFLLRPAQRKLVREMESMRLQGVPIRIILLKCRQWGGSTCVQIYMAWIQIFWKKSWNSIIVGHQGDSAAEVKDMYIKLIDQIPDFLLYEDGEQYCKNKNKIVSGGTQNISLIPSRNSKIKTASALNPESARGGDVAMAHCTEVAFWPQTDKMNPRKQVKSSCSGIGLMDKTVIVYESTPNGSENFFKDEWDRANNVDEFGERASEFVPVFVSWFEIESYLMPIDNKEEFALWLYDHKDSGEKGKYFWWLWEKGATLEGIKWYSEMLKRYDDPDDMKQEYPSDDIEAFKYSGTLVFNVYDIKVFESMVKDPVFEGDIYGDAPKGDESVNNIRIKERKNGMFRIWDYPDTEWLLENRYFVSVDIGGKSKNSDFSCITVLDRADVMSGGLPKVVAEWYGHCDPDVLAITVAQIAIYYCDALVIVENNTAYSRMNDTDGDMTELFFPVLLPLYSNIYCDNYSETEIKKQKEKKWGFNTNKATKPALIMNLNTVIRDKLYIERDKKTLIEYTSYMKYPNGSYGAIKGKHDDKLMSRAIGLFISMFKYDLYPVREKKKKVIKNTRPITAASPV